MHFGNILAVGTLGFEDDFLTSENEDIIISSMIYVSVCHIAMFYGTIFNQNGKSEMSLNFINIDFNLLNKLGYLCFAIGVFPKIWIDSQQVAAQMAGGYLSSLGQITRYGPISILAQFFYPGVFIVEMKRCQM